MTMHEDAANFFATPEIARRAQAWVDRLNVIAPQHSGAPYVFDIEPRKGSKTLRVVMNVGDPGYPQCSVHAFVGPDGKVYKAEGWSRTAKGVRYDLAKDIDRDILTNLDSHQWAGGYLYR